MGPDIEGESGLVLVNLTVPEGAAGSAGRGRKPALVVVADQGATAPQQMHETRLMQASCRILNLHAELSIDLKSKHSSRRFFLDPAVERQCLCDRVAHLIKFRPQAARANGACPLGGEE